MGRRDDHNARGQTVADPSINREVFWHAKSPLLRILPVYSPFRMIGWEDQDEADFALLQQKAGWSRDFFGLAVGPDMPA
jgi:hypothetical protein